VSKRLPPTVTSDVCNQDIHIAARIVSNDCSLVARWREMANRVVVAHCVRWYPPCTTRHVLQLVELRSFPTGLLPDFASSKRARFRPAAEFIAKRRSHDVRHLHENAFVLG
jgi:hypothetical protein